DAGRYSDAVDFMASAVADLRPGQPTVHLCNGFSLATLNAMRCGRWSDCDLFGSYLSQAWEELRGDLSAGFLSYGFGASLHVALAREDRPSADAAAATLKSLA